MRFLKHVFAAQGDKARVSRRDFLGGAAGAAGASVLAQMIPGRALASPPCPAPPHAAGPFTDDPVTLDWIFSRWDDLDVWGDTVGTLVEINEAKRKDALKLGARGDAKVYSLGEPMRAGTPAFPHDPPRRADYWIAAYGPVGENEFFYQDERFEAFTFQQATQVDDFGHPSFGGWFYGGHRFEQITPRPEILDPLDRQALARADSEAANYGPGSILGGTKSLGIQNIGPIVTRGLLLDVLGYKRAVGHMSAIAPNGKSLAPGYRITIADLQATMDWEDLDCIEPGDVVVIRTGWSHYWANEALWPTYLGAAPGPWIAECHWLAQFRPAIVASDTYAMEVFPGPRATALAEGHQVLMVANGIRIGEGFNSAALAADKVYEFMFFDTPYNLAGATCAGNAPAAIGGRKKKK
ncbi:cyclase family protein [Polyangium fumosum]|nr:cyclase family protein [Polyangium fumosum]